MAQYLEILRKQISKAAKVRELHAAGYSKKSIIQWLTISQGQYEQALRGKAARVGRNAAQPATNTERIVTRSANLRATVNPDNSRQIFAITEGFGTKSEKARKLAALGIGTSEIARLLGMSVGHARQAIQGRGSRSAGTRTASTTNKNDSQSSSSNEETFIDSRAFSTNPQELFDYIEETGYAKIDTFYARLKLAEKAASKHRSIDEKIKATYPYVSSSLLAGSILRITSSEIRQKYNDLGLIDEFGNTSTSVMRFTDQQVIEKAKKEIIKVMKSNKSTEDKVVEMAQLGLGAYAISRLLRIPINKGDLIDIVRTTQRTMRWGYVTKNPKR